MPVLYGVAGQVDPGCVVALFTETEGGLLLARAQKLRLAGDDQAATSVVRLQNELAGIILIDLLDGFFGCRLLTRRELSFHRHVEPRVPRRTLEAEPPHHTQWNAGYLPPLVLLPHQVDDQFARAGGQRDQPRRVAHA